MYDQKDTLHYFESFQRFIQQLGGTKLVIHVEKGNINPIQVNHSKI
ncbi:hypothetical protein ABEY43_25410 [Priestia megaterium]|nr:MULTISPECIES: hypothetical protein [Priestia]MCE4093242.1 hypothetical protein [Priestia megaterium]MDP1442489.1 hypothetical protein [Priestia megaterium]MDP1471511.1 hypothetical protein [Priestia megaterium]MDR0132285.1 hypothetical protein [Priestia megaterium]MDR7207162.1 hypothetical protein [Priestia megaterium]